MAVSVLTLDQLVARKRSEESAYANLADALSSLERATRVLAAVRRSAGPDASALATASGAADEGR